MEKENIAVEESFVISDFEQQYLEVRKKEQQHYTNDQIALLPEIPKDHPHYTEWLLRKKSCNRLAQYLKKIKKPLTILEVGCGNGWLSSKLAEIDNATVTGTDINATELKQASSVFKNKSNLHFVQGNIMNGLFSDKKFDVIVFAASIQYFPSLTQLLQTALKLLTQDGEIHILDSPLYENGASLSAKQRSKDYCESLGFPLMAAYYFQHSFSEIKSFKYRVMYNSFSIVNKLFKRQNPFHWIRISN